MKIATSTGQNVGIGKLNKCAAGALLAMMLLLFGCGGGSDDPLANHYANGQPTQSGSLENGDANSAEREGSKADYYMITGDGEVTIDLTGDFDTYLTLYDENGVELDHDDDGGAGLNSRITVTLTAGRVYYLEVTSYDDDESGSYTLATSNGLLSPSAGTSTDDGGVTSWGSTGFEGTLNGTFIGSCGSIYPGQPGGSPSGNLTIVIDAANGFTATFTGWGGTIHGQLTSANSGRAMVWESAYMDDMTGTVEIQGTIVNNAGNLTGSGTWSSRDGWRDLACAGTWSCP
jgi:hypothetical protein